MNHYSDELMSAVRHVSSMSLELGPNVKLDELLEISGLSYMDLFETRESFEMMYLLLHSAHRPTFMSRMWALLDEGHLVWVQDGEDHQ
jgi:hypothetical protein